ncbi:MAG: peptidoglycan DD-metalloendopeptidase family protein, partial [Anaerolineales bacterium]|nr:peptidoglycan DD-metalloendopeptidase family protein [Anaerolineales bacterium]
AAVVAAVAAGLVGLLLFSGGMLKVRAWYLLQSLLPALGLITLVLSGLAALVRRHASPALLLTGVLSGLALVPAVQILAPIMAYPASITAMTPSATVRLPADAPLTVLWGGDTLAVNRHVVVPDQRWAYDLVVAPYLTGSARLTDYGCYGLPVLAPAAGVVVVAHDGEPDRVPGAGSQNFEAPEGNFVALRLETGTYLILAHLKPGSLAVQVGERVAEGQPLGQCGHAGPPMPEGGVQLLNGQLIASGQTVRDLGQGGQVRRQP